MNLYEMNLDNIKKFSGSEKSVSQIVETLLELNKMIPKRNDSGNDDLINVKFENSENRGECDCLTENQMKKNRKINENSIIENELKEDKNNGHDEDSFNINNKKTNGHKDIPLIWHEVYKIEKNRKNKPMEKKLK